MKRFLERVAFLLATGFGTGLYAPFAPGTFGSIPGIALVWGLSYAPVWVQIVSSLALSLLAVVVCGSAESRLGIKDDGRIVADEWMLLPMAFIALPVREMGIAEFAVMFAVVRAVDILKPWPCRRLQSIKGGLGIVIDDFAAAVYSLGLNWLIWTRLFV